MYDSRHEYAAELRQEADELIALADTLWARGMRRDAEKVWDQASQVEGGMWEVLTHP